MTIATRKSLVITAPATQTPPSTTTMTMIAAASPPT